jgi:hypothetical protein
MTQIIYHVFLQGDGRYGVALSRFGTIGRVATGFAAQSDTQAWIEADKRLEVSTFVSVDGLPPLVFPFTPDKNGSTA